MSCGAGKMCFHRHICVAACFCAAGRLTLPVKDDNGQSGVRVWPQYDVGRTVFIQMPSV